jgi:hypothetical protein
MEATYKQIITFIQLISSRVPIRRKDGIGKVFQMSKKSIMEIDWKQNE